MPETAILAQKDHIVINHEAIAHAHALIAAGKVSHDAWDESKVDRASGNGSSFLGKDTSMKPEDAGYWKYPVIAGGEVNRKALGSAAAYAAKNGLDEIAAAARSLGEAADKKKPEGMSAKPTTHVHLRSGDFAGVSVDEANAVISNAAVMTAGDAQGHGFSIDRTTLEQVANLINRSPGGVTVRFKHPGRQADANGAPPDALGTDVGYLRNARIVGGSVRGDVHLADYAEVLPGLGNVKDYLLRKAKTDPSGFGLSAVIAFDAEPTTDAAGRVTGLVARVSDVEAVDFVSRPAANPNGLLSSKPTTRRNNPMNDKMKKYMVENHGLASDATDEQATTMYNSLSKDDQAKCAAASMTAPPSKATPLSATPPPPAAPAIAELVIKAEKERVGTIRQLAGLYGETIPANVVQMAIAEKDTLDAATTRFLAHLAKTCKPIEDVAPGSVNVGADRNIASLGERIGNGVRIRAGVQVKDASDGARQMAQVSLIDMGRQYLSALGVENAYTVSRMKIWDMLMHPRHVGGRYAMLAEGTGAFTNVTLDAINKTLRMAYLDGPRNWDKIFRMATNPDFKNINRIAFSDAPAMIARQGGGELKYGVMADSKETYTLQEYVLGIRLTRQAIINDDLDAFGRIPMLQGNTARRTEDDVAFAILTANATLADTGALFNATAVSTAGGHANLDSATANVGVPTVTTLALGRKALRVQRGPKGAYLNLVPRYLLVPGALETAADQYTSANFQPLQSSTINPFATGGRSALTPVVEPRLDAASANAWYLLADVGQIDTVEVCFLQDEPEPVLRQETDFDTEDVKFAVRHTVAAKAIDFRGMYKNNGA